MIPTRPMLAGKCTDINKLRYPVLATPKLDGIRCLIVNGKALSRKFKEIPNEYVRKWLEENCPSGFDGELMLRGGTFQQTSSAIMSRDGKPDFVYQVFDWVVDILDEPYEVRMDYLDNEGRIAVCSKVELILPKHMHNPEALELYEEQCLLAGYEGVMVRDPDGPYKCGRSTEREGFLLKIKRFKDAEAVIIDVEERMHNANPAEVNELGLTKRSSHKANQVPMGVLGALIVKDCTTDVEFKIGTGFDDEMRELLWKIRDRLPGKMVKYKFQPSGVKDKPRFPVYLGLRSSIEGE